MHAKRRSSHGDFGCAVSAVALTSFIEEISIENGLLTRFDFLLVDKLTGCPDLFVRQSFEFACAAVTHLNRIYLLILNRDRLPQLNRPTRRFRSCCHDPDQLPCNREFLVRRLGARADAHERNQNGNPPRETHSSPPLTRPEP